MIDGFLFDRDRDVSVYYIPIERLNPDARVVLIRIAPGFSQMGLDTTLRATASVPPFSGDSAVRPGVPNFPARRALPLTPRIGRLGCQKTWRDA